MDNNFKSITIADETTACSEMQIQQKAKIQKEFQQNIT